MIFFVVVVSPFHEWVSIRWKEGQALGTGDGKILPLTGLTQETISMWIHGKQRTHRERNDSKAEPSPLAAAKARCGNCSLSRQHPELFL